ncbi:Ran-specific GTPase-activating protein [Lachnellula hyalina]|uniref:Ran-specific GTPase-activating protein n=1 Tax=Lachnellula hyalina TaxID=1316788 RepID=A0A8H8TZ79_9HELO|nr:Ran-specific GTPase-activating protein [Lachnellula hyalina]TVY25567.1 Ran-specific GTPase-activating protein [Lachnellula hyalina]
MDVLLGKITQHAMNYAIRSGIGITASFAIGQTSRLLKTVDDNGVYQELRDLQERLNSKIRCQADLNSSARGNTTLESAVTLTKSLRWDIQSLGIRLEKAAAAEETSRKNRNKAKTRASHELEIRHIIQDIKKLLTRFEDAVPLINLAITTSGANLSTTLPASVSPSRLLQASTLLTAGDTQYRINSGSPTQVGSAFTLSLYMLFAGHAFRAQEDSESTRETTWKEVIHKARVKLMRVPLNYTGHSNKSPAEHKAEESSTISGEGKAMEFAYHIEIIEDLDDDRVHSFEDDETQPGPYGDVLLAGIRETLPIHQISKIFYADTGKILNIGSQGETNNPVLLLKRDINALPPRRMMEENEKRAEWYEDPEELGTPEDKDDSQDDIDQQIRRESCVVLPLQEPDQPAQDNTTWCFPPDLDPEWLALEVYMEEPDSSSEDDQEPTDDSAYASHRPSSSSEEPNPSSEDLAAGLAGLDLSSKSPSPSPAQLINTPSPPQMTPKPRLSSNVPHFPYGQMRSSLSLLEMLIRLTALQQFQQASHLTISDEFLTFFLEESSTTGAGGDADNRRRTRREARRKVGFDPYDESPVKRHGEEYQYEQREGYERGGTPFTEYDRYDGGGYHGYGPASPSPRGTPEPWLLRGCDVSSSPRPRRSTSDIPPSSPMSPYRPVRSSTRPLPVQRVKNTMNPSKGSPLGRGVSVETDSTLGTSPGSPVLGTRGAKGEKN